jgi:hypothetical protein
MGDRYPSDVFGADCETLDELEDGNARLDLCLEATPIEQLAFECGEEALRHCVVVSDRPHRGPNTRLPTAFAELDRGMLRALIRMVDHAARPLLTERDVEGHGLRENLAELCALHAFSAHHSAKNKLPDAGTRTSPSPPCPMPTLRYLAVR